MGEFLDVVQHSFKHALPNRCLPVLCRICGEILGMIMLLAVVEVVCGVESWQQRHVGGIEGSSCQHQQVVMTQL